MAWLSRLALLSMVALAGDPNTSIASPPGERATRGVWTVRGFAFDTYEQGQIGQLPRRGQATGDFLLGMRHGTTYGLGVSFDSRWKVAIGLDLLAGKFQFGGDSFVGFPDSVDIESDDLCRATSVAVQLSLRPFTSNVFRRDSGWKAYLESGGLIVVDKLEGLTVDQAGAEKMGVRSVQSAIGFGGGFDFEGGLRIARSRWCLGIRGSLIAGGAKLDVKTHASSRWASGTARIGPEVFGLFLGYSPP
jgi:hypothetical protein